MNICSILGHKIVFHLYSKESQVDKQVVKHCDRCKKITGVAIIVRGRWMHFKR